MQLGKADCNFRDKDVIPLFVISPQRRKQKEKLAFRSVQLVIILLREGSLKKECNVFLLKNTGRHYKYPNNNLHTFVEFSVDIGAFSPCSARDRPPDFHCGPSPQILIPLP